MPIGTCKARSWVARREGGPRLRGPNELLGGKRGRMQQQQQQYELQYGKPMSRP